MPGARESGRGGCRGARGPRAPGQLGRLAPAGRARARAALTHAVAMATPGPAADWLPARAGCVRGPNAHRGHGNGRTPPVGPGAGARWAPAGAVGGSAVCRRRSFSPVAVLWAHSPLEGLHCESPRSESMLCTRPEGVFGMGRVAPSEASDLRGDLGELGGTSGISRPFQKVQAVPASSLCTSCPIHWLSHPLAIPTSPCISLLSSIASFSKPSTRLPGGFALIHRCLPSAP
ncbi:uncharacterized protein LOC122235142 [Panthera tigris]|uniref:uncharacterized protein LOC122235142 n=1 Tax=Panthera tigris TaxID=9694 RepID=UPI001C6F94D6|nr:uncharacterized protein LOC122235142 [Panthera tigris]